jgi:hypothetical protein
LTRYKTFINPPPPQNNRSNLSIEQAAPRLKEDYCDLLSLYKILLVQVPFGVGITFFGYGKMVG